LRKFCARCRQNCSSFVVVVDDDDNDDDVLLVVDIFNNTQQKRTTIPSSEHFSFFSSALAQFPPSRKFLAKSSSEKILKLFFDSSFVVQQTEDKKSNHGINVSAREDRSVRRLFDATRDRTRRMGREFGTSSESLYSFPFSFRLLYYALCVLFLCVSVLMFFIFLNLIARSRALNFVVKKKFKYKLTNI
jgi:hypothetical protein